MQRAFLRSIKYEKQGKTKRNRQHPNKVQKEEKKLGMPTKQVFIRIIKKLMNKRPGGEQNSYRNAQNK